MPIPKFYLSNNMKGLKGKGEQARVTSVLASTNQELKLWPI